MRRKGILVSATILVALLLAPTAYARLAAVGLLNPTNGFPSYYVDTNGVALDLTIPPFGTPIGAPQVAPTMVFDAPLAANFYSQQIGFGTEASYYNCTAQSLVTAYGTFTFQVGLVASFANSVPPLAKNGDQTVFSRLRCTVSGLTLPAGIYTLSHPYGVETIIVNSGKGLNYTRDIPLSTKLDFTSVMESDVGPFLLQIPPPGTFPVNPPFNTGWIGDGVTPGPITGSPIGYNRVRLEAPRAVNLDGAGHNFIETSNFIVSGHQYPNAISTPLNISRLTYTRDAGGTIVDIFATSVLGATVTATITPGSAPITLQGGSNQLAGLFFTRTGNTTITSLIQFTATAGTTPPTFVFKAPVDLVTISQAVWHERTQIMTVVANSSDTLAPAPTLTVTNPSWGPMVNGVLNIACPVPPTSVTVASGAGGSATEMVQVVTP